ncbi:Hypothetical protein, putative [Bodo saltans]|uniref:Uncharacterized protein n=1 Tax=Bodo saltans TaxID=75058 RepID=A0A0S4JIV4_BODSA|nr:Hypothetical protein, putative [Bodo saltans]|eukprot:CUG90477.1 Hypothetical protein, putative [Bodo saltans]
MQSKFMSVPFHHKNLFHHEPPPSSTPSPPIASCQPPCLDALSHHPQNSFPLMSPSTVLELVVPNEVDNEYTIDKAIELVLRVLPDVHRDVVRARCIDVILNFGRAHHDYSAIAAEVINFMLIECPQGESRPRGSHKTGDTPSDIDKAVERVLDVLPYVHPHVVRARCIAVSLNVDGAHHDSSAIADEVINFLLTECLHGVRRPFQTVISSPDESDDERS